jgi:hypothetical protein
MACPEREKAAQTSDGMYRVDDRSGVHVTPGGQVIVWVVFSPWCIALHLCPTCAKTNSFMILGIARLIRTGTDTEMPMPDWRIWLPAKMPMLD